MYKINFREPGHVHFIGIGGISMSGLAQILMREGFTVSGSDVRKSALTEKLEEKGVRMSYAHKAENITDDIGCVIYTAAISRDNAELIEAVSKKIPKLSRAELLGQIMKNYKTSIAVSGTHGKTTTTAMISHVLLEAGLDPTISLGGILDAIGGNIRVGASDTFITEACEYTNSFLHFCPKISVILNIEEDHLDFFRDIEDIRSSFCQFAALLPRDGALVINSDIKNYEEITSGLKCKVITYGKYASSDYSGTDPVFDEKGRVSFDLVKHGRKSGHITLCVPGEHNMYNALASAAVCELLGISLDTVKKGLLSFTGTKRRFEYKGTRDGVTIIDDYAHHPTEIKATLSAAQHYPHKKLWCVFQPHTYTRTKAFFTEFAEALSHADHVVLADIYGAREKDTLGISSCDLSEEIKKNGTDSHYFPDFAMIEDFLVKNCAPGDLLIVMGAGDITDVSKSLLK